MDMSANAARALEQVKLGLSMLYGADYFTEDEWIKVDGLIHKGKYVFTQGPPRNILEEPLMTFEDSTDEPTEDSKKEVIVVSEIQIPSATSDEASTDFPSETPNETSAEGSSDGQLASDPPAGSTMMFDFSDNSTPSSIEPVETAPAPAPPARPANGGFALGYTQAQLDKIKAFNANLTKAGQKKRPKYTSNQDLSPYPESERDDSLIPEDTVVPQSPPSSNHTEQDSRIHTWASAINPEEVTPVASPAPSRPLYSNGVPVEAVEQFVQTHGRKPKVVNDVFQPNNPEFNAKRSESITSRNAPVTPIQSSVNPARGNPKLNCPAGTVLHAISSAMRNSKIQIDVLSGDQIKYIKHVSGIMHTGLNLRTNESGQFPESILRKAPGAAASSNPLVEQQRHSARVGATGRERVFSTTSTVSNGLDRVEGINAAAWDEAPKSKLASSRPGPARPTGGLANSRFALLSDFESRSLVSASESGGISRDEVGKMFDEKFAQILAAQQHSAAKKPPMGPSAVRSSSLNETLQPVPPKSATCWFWGTNKGCRFTAEECRDLHAHVPGNPVNLHKGRPTWGSFADSVPSPASYADPSGNEYKYSSKSKTCWYWANDGKCSNTADTCKYLHKRTLNGVAAKPGGWRKKDFNWERRRDPHFSGEQDYDEEDEEDEEDMTPGWELTDENGSANDWGHNPTTWETPGWESPVDKYKPPHVKALEAQASIDALPW